MRQSELDPCCFRYYHDHELHGVLALHVDDMVFGGHMFSWRTLSKRCERSFPSNTGSHKEVSFLVGH